MKSIEDPLTCLVLACIVALCLGSCSDLFMEDPQSCSFTIVEKQEMPAVSMDDILELPTIQDEDCIRTEYYLCPGITGPLMRIEVVKNICEDPPIVLSMSECKEFLECNPSTPILSEESCKTTTGDPGVRKVYCNKGFIKHGPCIGLCIYESCDITEDKDINEDDVDFTIEDSHKPDYEECVVMPVDILFLLDMSASMKNEIDEVVDATNFFASQYKNDNILWSMIVGPLNAGQTPGNKNYLALVSDLEAIEDFKKQIQIVTSYDLTSQYEMLYDALYLAIRNISLFLPYENDILLWPTWVGEVFSESVPPLADFKISWRENSKKIIVVFTNEVGQSFLFPLSKKGKSYNTKDTITKSKLSLMLQTIDNLSVYTFTDEGSKSGPSGWAHFSQITGGGWNDLHGENISYDLSNIIEENVCP